MKEDSFFISLITGILSGGIVWLFGILYSVFKEKGFISAILIPIFSLMVLLILIWILFYIFLKKVSQ